MSACAGSQVGETLSMIKGAAEAGNIMLHQIEERLNDMRQEKGQESQTGDKVPKETTLKGSNGVPGLNNLNKQAILLARSGDHVGATACLTHLLDQARRCNVTHPELYVCLSNRCNSFLALECFSEALEDARQALLLIQKAFPGGRHAFHPLFTKVTVRMGQALLGMCCHREALMAFEDALKLNPDNIDARVGLERAHQAMLRSVLQGENLERRALPPPAPSLRIASLPHSSPAHHIRCEDRLPTQLLTPFQAERDPSTRDIYNYCTVQADTRLPLRYLDQYLQDRKRLTLSSQAVQHAVQEVQARGVDCRVLIVGSGAAGLMAMVALKAGALHVTCVERWMYMAQSCREVLVHNGASLEDFKVVCKRPCDLTSEDVPIPPNLVIACDLIDEGILTGGLLTAVKSVMQKGLVMLDAVIIPSSITIKVQAMQAQTAPSVCGIQLGALDRYRWLTGPAGVCSASNMRLPAASRPSTSTHLPDKLLTSDSSSSCKKPPPPPLPYIFRPLSEPQECWTFDLYCPPEESCHKHVDLEMKVDGNWNAVLYWAEVRLYKELSWSTGFGQHAENCHHDQKSVTCASIQPALQYMAGSLSVHPQMVLPLLVSHNTVRLKFDLEEGEYQYLHKRDASLPRHHFAMAADTVRLEAYNKALKKAVQLIKTGATASAATPALSHTSVQALDLGCGTGVLAMLAARAGADHVVAVEAHPTLCEIARRNVAMNGLSRKVSVVNEDVSNLQRGTHLSHCGANLVVLDLFDAGLLGNNCMRLLAAVRQRVLQPGAIVVPSSASLYCMGVEVLTRRCLDFDLSPINKFRWTEGYTPVQLANLPHRALTAPQLVSHITFSDHSHHQDTAVTLTVIRQGVLNAVVFWFDLHMDPEGQEVLSNAPPSAMDPEGQEVLSNAPPTAMDLLPTEDSGNVTASEVVGGCSVRDSDVHCIMPEGAEQGPGSTNSTPPSSCYWGQGLQYLDIATVVVPAAKSRASTAADDQQETPAAASATASATASAHNGTIDKDAYQVASDEDGPNGIGNEVDDDDDDSKNAARGGYEVDAGDDDSKNAARGGYEVDAGDDDSNNAARGGDVIVADGEAPMDEGLGSRRPAVLHNAPCQDRRIPPLKANTTEGQVTLLVKRTAPNGALSFSLHLKEGMAGIHVPKSPWKVEWGGGASIENPHRQRVLYCELLVKDLLQRLPCGRFPSVEEDFKVMEAHCGSLYLDSTSIAEAWHELCLMEVLYRNPSRFPSVLPEHISSKLLTWG